MGDRALVYVIGSPAAVYVHWSGHRILQLIADCVSEDMSEADGYEGRCRLRIGDESYSSARLLQYLGNCIDGNLGFGFIEKPENVERETLVDYSHGDAGVILVDVTGGRSLPERLLDDGPTKKPVDLVRIKGVGGYLEEDFPEWTSIADFLKKQEEAV